MSETPKTSPQVLVTGGSGFVGTHCMIQLLQAGYRVRTTVRSLKREPEIRAMLGTQGIDALAPLAFFEADLMSDQGWTQAVTGCDYVLHVASPFPLRVPKHEDDLIVPAREGTLRVLKAARNAEVKRIVITSSFAAVGYGTKVTGRPFIEEDWTDIKGAGITAYVKSKTLAEQAAWNFIRSEGNGLELSTVNPVGIFGPVLSSDFATSIQLVQKLMDGAIPGCPRLAFGVVDVRDVADLHLKAMTHPKAKGERFLAVAGESLSMHQVAVILKNQLGRLAKRVPSRVLPDWLVKAIAFFDPTIAQIIPELGTVKQISNEKAKTRLGWTPRSNEEAILASAESLARLGLLKHSV